MAVAVLRASLPAGEELRCLRKPRRPPPACRRRKAQATTAPRPILLVGGANPRRREWQELQRSPAAPPPPAPPPQRTRFSLRRRPPSPPPPSVTPVTPVLMRHRASQQSPLDKEMERLLEELRDKEMELLEAEQLAALLPEQV